MGQPTGAIALNPSWRTKGLKLAMYVTTGGMFVADDVETSVPVSGSLTVTTAVASNGDIRLNRDRTGGSGETLLSANAPALGAALADNMTWVTDIHPTSGVSGMNAGEVYSVGGSNPGGVALQVANTSATSTTLRFNVNGATYGPSRGASILLSGATQKRVAFRYRRGQPVGVFVDGVSVTPTAADDAFTGATPVPNDTRFLILCAGYALIPRLSHLYGFNTDLSDADISALAVDPWQVFGAGSGGSSANAAGVTLSSGGILIPGVASASALGSFTTSAMVNNTGSRLANTAVVWEWRRGNIGAAPAGVTYGSGTTGADGRLMIAGLPMGAGVLLAATPDGQNVYYEAGNAA